MPLKERKRTIAFGQGLAQDEFSDWLDTSGFTELVVTMFSAANNVAVYGQSGSFNPDNADAKPTAVPSTSNTQILRNLDGTDWVAPVARSTSFGGPLPRWIAFRGAGASGGIATSYTLARKIA